MMSSHMALFFYGMDGCYWLGEGEGYENQHSVPLRAGWGFVLPYHFDLFSQQHQKRKTSYLQIFLVPLPGPSSALPAFAAAHVGQGEHAGHGSFRPTSCFTKQQHVDMVVIWYLEQWKYRKIWGIIKKSWAREFNFSLVIWVRRRACITVVPTGLCENVLLSVYRLRTVLEN